MNNFLFRRPNISKILQAALPKGERERDKRGEMREREREEFERKDTK